MTTETPSPAVTWRVRAVRRAAWTVGSAVVLAAVGPAVANAAGAHVRNPIAVALRALGSDAPQPSCVTPTESAPEPSESVEPSVDPSADASATEQPVVVPAEPSEPAESEAPDPSEAPESEAPDCEASATPTVEPSESEVPEPSDAPESEAPEPSESADAHGAVVSTVAHCAPKGHDPLLDVDGAPGSHGAFVSAAAHGTSLTTPWGTFDLSTQAGADALCAAVDAARAALPPAPAKTHGKQAKEHRKPHVEKSHEKHAEAEHGDESSDESGDQSGDRSGDGGGDQSGDGEG
jgi:hypothetical protein